MNSMQRTNTMRLRMYISMEEHDKIQRVDRRKLESLFVTNMHRAYPDPASVNQSLLHIAEPKTQLLRMVFDFHVPPELEKYRAIIRLISRRKGGYNLTRMVLVNILASLPELASQGKRLRKKLLSPEILFYNPTALIGMIQRELLPADDYIAEIDRNLLVFDWSHIPPEHYPARVQEHALFERLTDFYNQMRCPSV